MSLEGERRQKTGQLELAWGDKGEAPKDPCSGEAPTAAKGNERSGSDLLMEQVVERSNAKAAIKRVRQNKGSAGIDGVSVEELPTYLAEHWETIRKQHWRGPTSRNQSSERRYPRAAEVASWGFLAQWIGSSNKPYCRCCNPDSTQLSRSTATASDLDAAHTMRCVLRRSTSSKDTDG